MKSTHHSSPTLLAIALVAVLGVAGPATAQRTQGEPAKSKVQAEAAFIRIAGATRALMDAVWDHYERERDSAPAPVQGDLEDLLAQAPAPQPALAQPAQNMRPRVRKMRVR